MDKISSKNKIKAIIFDMDGVIINSEPIYEEVNKKIYPEYGINLTQAERDSLRGTSLFDSWQKLLNKFEVKAEYSHYKIEDFIEQHIHSYYEGLANSEDLKLMPGVKAWFEFFKEHGYKMIIASSSYPPVVEYIYQRFELAEYFIGYVDSTTIINGKPAPDIYLRAAKRLNFKPGECLVIEDSENGVKGAKAAGCKVIAYNRAADPSQDLAAADLEIAEFSRDNLHKIFA
jgi:HAD superfamily hydrolase (TIGR01509 family)